MTDATPRINASLLEQFSNRTVRILGKVIDLRGDTAVVDAGGQITVLLSRVRVSRLITISDGCVALMHEHRTHICRKTTRSKSWAR